MPRDDAADVDWLLFRQSGVLSRRQALRWMSDARLRHVVSSGRWTRPHRGIYVASNGEVTGLQHVWIGALATAAGGRHRSGLTALESYGFRGYDARTIHVHAPASMQPRGLPSYVVVHRARLLASDRQRGLPARTTPARAAVDAARWAGSDDQARAIIAAAFQQRLVHGDGMLGTLARLPSVRRRALITVTIRDAATGSESIAEHDFLRLCRRGRLPVPARQSVTVDKYGQRRYRDAYFDEFDVHVEIDGGQHTDVREWWADMRRQNAMGIHGRRVLRFPAWALRHDSNRVIADLRAALIAAGWRP
jgi:very-short-patch-repair endonuclease